MAMTQAETFEWLRLRSIRLDEAVATIDQQALRIVALESALRHIRDTPGIMVRDHARAALAEAAGETP